MAAKVRPCLDESWRLPGFDISISAAPYDSDWLWPRVIPPAREIAGHVQVGGLELADIHDADRDLFIKAAEAIAWTPSLAAIVATRVVAVHLLRADPGYDISHSEPQWSDRIFVSLPDRRDQIGAVRLAECIIHEALHLHLTEFEAISPAGSGPDRYAGFALAAGASQFGGVLHGAFVFAGLRAYFDAVIASSDSTWGPQIDQRRAEISKELSEINEPTLKAGLTEQGGALLSRLFDCLVTERAEISQQ